MARFIVLLLAVSFFAAAAVEARVTFIRAGDSKELDESNSVLIGRKLLGAPRPVLIDVTNSVNATAGRVLTGEDECQRTCDQVKFRTMCRSLTRLPGVTTPEALLKAAVRVGLTKARQAKRRVDAYRASYHGGNPMDSMLSTCSEGYGNVADSLAAAQRLIDGGHATGADLNRKLSFVTTSALDCTNAFDERPEIPSPFPGTVRNVYRVVDNVLNIAYAVKHV